MLLNKQWRYYHNRWLNKRVPASASQILHRKNIFIFPSTLGLSFFLTVFLLWLLGTNYQNNLIIVLAFLLLSLLHTCIFHTYANFSGLVISRQKVSSCFAGDALRVQLSLQANNNSKRTRAYYHIRLLFPHSNEVNVDVSPEQEQTATLLVNTERRGLHRLNRLSLSTVYPLGIMRAWAYLDLDIEYVVYPKRIATRFPNAKRSRLDDDQDTDHEVQDSHEQGDEISHLKPYAAGDSPKHIAWRTYAKRQVLATKAYDDTFSVAEQHWFDWHDFSGMPVEERLSRLCDIVIQAEEKNIAYGLRLPYMSSEIGQGKKHCEQLLYLLATYQHRHGELGVVNNGKA